MQPPGEGEALIVCVRLRVAVLHRRAAWGQAARGSHAVSRAQPADNAWQSCSQPAGGTWDRRHSMVRPHGGRQSRGVQRRAGRAGVQGSQPVPAVMEGSAQAAFLPLLLHFYAEAAALCGPQHPPRGPARPTAETPRLWACHRAPSLLSPRRCARTARCCRCCCYCCLRRHQTCWRLSHRCFLLPLFLLSALLSIEPIDGPFLLPAIKPGKRAPLRQRRRQAAGGGRWAALGGDGR